MKKIAIVGPEGSGKTVMLAVLGELYSRPDRKGYFLEPLNLQTAVYLRKLYSKLQCHEWPSATEVDDSRALKWNLRRVPGRCGQSKIVGEVTCLDFAGEIYRAAFSGDYKRVSTSDVDNLMEHLLNADTIVLLLNLRDSITHGVDDSRAVETEFAAKEILKLIFESSGFSRAVPNVLLALSQADAYEATIEASGGAKGTLFKYLPLVANTFGYLPVLSVHSCKTRLDDDANSVPEPEPAGLVPVMEWILASSVGGGRSLRGVMSSMARYCNAVMMSEVTWGVTVLAPTMGLFAVLFSSDISNKIGDLGSLVIAGLNFFGVIAFSVVHKFPKLDTWYVRAAILAMSIAIWVYMITLIFF